MLEVEILKRLIYEANVQINVLAQICQCSPSAIANYAKGSSLPTGTKQIAIKEGLKKYKELINEIIQE